jgi:glycosyltransferase involved in cell wall biosynthesis
LFPVDNALALADAMGRLAGDPSLRARYAMTARKLVVERLTAEIIGRQTVALYKRVINKTLDADHSLLL